MDLTQNLIDRFVDAHMALITVVWSAIWAYQREPEHDWDETVQVWIHRVCENLHRTHARIKDGRDAFLEAGETGLIKHCAFLQLGLSRDLNEFDLDWATHDHVQAIDKTLDRLVEIALMVSGLRNEAPQI